MIELLPAHTSELLALWGAAVSSGLAGIKIWETFWKDRVRLASTYSLTDQDGEPHTITVANLSSLPVQISSAELYWVPNFLSFPRRSPSSATPDHFFTETFKIDGHDAHSFEFADQDKFSWDYKTTDGRKLYLYLHVFGRPSPVRLLVYDPERWGRGRWRRLAKTFSRFP